MLRKIISGDNSAAVLGKIAVKLILRASWDGPCSAGIVAESKFSERSSGLTAHAAFYSNCTHVVHGSFVDLYICTYFISKGAWRT